MSAQQGFTPDEMVSLNHYVYFLQDPRNDKIFYVGEGKGNGFLAHFKHAHESDWQNRRLDRIREIEAEGHEVRCFLARHGMSKQTAQEVKGALIDILLLTSEEDLTNDQRGHGSRQRGLWDFQGHDEDKRWGAPAENYK